MKNLICLFILINFLNVKNIFPADMVVFSCNRPLQLEAFLSSAKTYTNHVEKIFVLYSATTPDFRVGYQLVQTLFPDVTFIKQSKHSDRDFKKFLLKIVYEFSQREYVIFATDDALFTAPVDCNQDIQMLEESNAYGLYYVLGNHIIKCPKEQKAYSLPLSYKEVGNDFFIWNFIDGFYSFGAPHRLLVTLFNKNMIKEALSELDYSSPTSLENVWSKVNPIKSIGMAYKVARAIILRLNTVQKDRPSSTPCLASPEELNEFFLKQYKFDISTLKNIVHNSFLYQFIPSFMDYK